MTKKVVLEVATLADAAAKANRIAPHKGAAIDKSAGILIEVDPDAAEPMLIKSTDLQVTYRQKVNYLEMGDEAATWRVPSQLFAGALATFPMTLGSTVTLIETSDGSLLFHSGKTKAKLRLIMGGFPIIPAFNPDGLGIVAGLARRLTQVAWATDPRSVAVLSGVHLDGKKLYGCNRSVVAMVDCEVPLEKSVTAPLTLIASLIKNTGDLSLRATDNHLELMPDKDTQTTAVLFADPYPDIQQLLDRYNPDHMIRVESEALKAALDRMLVLVKAERMPSTEIEIGGGVMRLQMNVPDVGKIADEIEVEGGGDDKFKFMFTPGNLQNAINASGRSRIQIDYGPTPLAPIKVSDDDSFVSLLMPRRGDD